MLIKKLSEDDMLEGFDCGIEALNIFITKNVLNYQKTFASNTYLLKSNEKTCGFYSISATVIEQSQVNIRWPKHPLPAILLGRLAIDLNFQRQGLGSVLFADACKKVIEVANLMGCVA
ncbi:MAG: hypothetical protein EBV05_13945, partial [Cyanobacteria bacterium WB6_1B_304]|nr:hypothetical protein [Cyanobacteria bacterium WB6_1B_304]